MWVMGGLSFPASSHPSPSTTLPSVIQDAVWDKQLPQKLPDVSVGPVLGNDNQPHLPHHPGDGPIPGTFVHLALRRACYLDR